MTAPPVKTPSRNPYSYTPPKDDTPKIIRWGRILLTLALIPVGLSAFRSEYGMVPLLSDINLAIHEFGHVLFMPFGETMTILGGSLTQILLPLVFVWYFLYGKHVHRDKHAAMICLWWSSINVLSVAIYAADARARQLMLITGATGEDDPDSHDFFNLFAQWGVLNRDTVYAGRLRSLAGLMFFVSIIFGLYTGWRSGRENCATESRTSG